MNDHDDTKSSDTSITDTNKDETPQDAEAFGHEAETADTEPAPERERVMLRDYIDIPVKKHPKADIYSNNGNTTREYHQEMLEFIETLEPAEFADFQNGNLVLDDADTRSFIGEMEKGDLVGLRYSTYKVLDKTADSITCEDTFKRTYHEFNLPHIDASLGMNRGNILYRDGKPYGQPASVKKEAIYHIFKDQLKPGQEHKIVTKEQLEAEREEKRATEEASANANAGDNTVSE